MQNNRKGESGDAGRRGKRRGRGVRRLVWRSVLAPIGWAALLCGASILVVEHSGLLGRRLERRLAERLGVTSGELALGDVELSWLDRTLRLGRISLGRQDEDLVLEDTEVVLDWSPRHGLVVERIVVASGSLRVSRDLLEMLENVPGRSESEPLDLERLPELAVRELEVAAETPDWGDVDTGTVDAILVHEERGMKLIGEWRPPAEPEADADPARVYLSGTFSEDEVLEFRAAARGLGVDASLLPPAAALDGIRALDPRLRFDLEASGHFPIRRLLLPEIDVALTLREGELRAPMPDGGPPEPVQDLSLAARVAFRPGTSPDLWSRDAWSAFVHGEGTWLETPLTAVARLGREASEGNFADGWVHAPALRVDGLFQRVVQSVPWLANLDAMLAPRGTADLALALAVPDGWNAQRDGGAGIGHALVVRPGADASCAYVGQPNLRQGGVRNLGFPVRVDRLEGLVTHVHRPADIRPDRLGLHELVGYHGAHRIEARGALTNRPGQTRDAKGRVPFRPFFHLEIASDGLPVDGELERGFAGLVGVKGCEELWETYAPAGGELGFTLRFDQRPEQDRLATRLSVDVQEVDFRWRTLPVPVTGVRGRLELTVDGRRAGRFLVRAEGTSPAARGPVRVTGRNEGEAGENLLHFETSAEGLNLRNTELRAALDRRDPERHARFDRLGARGWVDLSATYSQALGSRAGDTWLEVRTPLEGCRLDLDGFPLETRDVQGRLAIAIHADEPGATPTTELGGVVGGRWPVGDLGMPVQAQVLTSADGTGRLSAVGAGIDLSNDGLLARIAGAVGASGDVMSRLDLEGFVDFAVDVPLDAGAGAPTDLELDLHARLERLGVGGVDLLGNLEGPVAYRARDRSLKGGRLRAELGGTPVELSDVSLVQVEGRTEFETRIDAHDLSIDREHLEHFLDARTVRTLLEDLEARGWFDLVGGLLRITSTEQGETSVGLSGILNLHDVFARIGVPIAVSSAEEIDLELFYEGGRARARAGVRELFGRVAERELDAASMQITYVEPRLTIEQFQGDFEGGRLKSLATPGSSSSGFFAVDLENPFPFSLATQLVDVDVGQLLEGVFRSDFANEGRVDAELRLDGDLGRLTGIRGRGEYRMRDTSLWAIPVFQALFAQLGFDTAAVFSSLTSRFTIEDGVLEIKELSVKSDLLSLVGLGSVDFDGSLDHELQVRYSVVDRLGPLRRLLYQIQNSLLRISIRGTLSRPEVVVEGLFSQFFRRSSDELRLPLPELAPLPTRF